MSDSVKDGRRGGGHKTGHQGKEYWSRRPPNDMSTPGREAKRQTHRAERRQARRQVAVEFEAEA